jgi:signal transduction histidine kinase
MSEKTYFASPEREDITVIQEQSKKIKELPYATDVLNTFPGFILVLNTQRQVIFANQIFINFLGLKQFEDALGQRPGELINCINSHDTEYGCGTGRNCRFCGAILTVLRCLETKQPQEGESRITTEHNNKITPLDLQVVANPLFVDNSFYVAVYMLDISSQKRRDYLERTFIHDIINSTGALSNRLEFFPHEGFDKSQMTHFTKIKTELSRILDDIEAQRDLIKIENNELTPKLKQVTTSDIIQSSIETISTDRVARDKKIEIDNACISKEIVTDKRLIRRVLINLLKNALEASKAGEIVTIGCKEQGSKIIFWVKNDAVMPEEVQSQIFQRFYSTKGPGRGLGTYSVKILVEQYLQGEVSFESNDEIGTIFKINLIKKH